MRDTAVQAMPTSTAATRQTEPEVVAAVSSGEGHATREQAIRERAYAMWEDEGRPDGRELDHWHRAEAEIDSAGQQSSSENG